MNLSQIKNIFNKNKKIILVFIIAFLIFSPELSFAATTTETESFKELKTTVISVTDWILNALAMILGLLTYLISLFLDPGWLNWSFFGLTDKFKEIWIMVSNVVYFIFAFILIWIAFMNILWKADKWELKQALPKFIISVLMVPFTWFFIQFVLAISAILTIAVLTLPSETFPDYESGLENLKVYKTCEVSLNWDSWESGNSFFSCPDEDANKTTLWELLSHGDASTSIFWVIYTYTYAVMNLDSIATVSWTTIFANVHNLADLIIKILMDLIFILIYAILIVALWLVLMTRWIYLWLFMMFSPVFALLFFFDKKEWGWEGFVSNFSVGKFISLALVPVYSMAALSFWLLFMFVVWHGMSSQAANDEGVLTTWSIKIDKDKITLWTPDDEWNWVFTLEIKWSIWNSDDAESGSLFKDMGDWALWIVWSLILQIFGIVILWWAMMAALKSSTITQTVIKPIEDFGNSVWTLMKNAPTYAPVFGGKSAAELASAWSTLQSSVSWSYSQKWADWSRKFYGGEPVINAIQDWFRGVSKSDPDQINQAIKKITPKINFNEKKEVEEYLEQLQSVWFKNELKVADLLSKDKTTIAKALYKNQNESLTQTGGYGSYTEYMRMLETNTSTNVWDTSRTSSNSLWKTTNTKYEDYKDWYEEVTNLANAKLQVDGSTRDIKIVLNEDGLWKEYSFNFNGSNKDDIESFVWDELEEAKKLYSMLWKDPEAFKEIIKKLWYEKGIKLLEQVK